MKTGLPIAFTAPVTMSPVVRMTSCVEISHPFRDDACTVNALWDLGAGISVLFKSIADRIGLEPEGKCRLLTAGGTVCSDVATACLRICIGGVGIDIQVAIIPDRNDGTATPLTIGADVITRGCLSVFPGDDGRPRFSFLYPPSAGIDYHEFCEKIGQAHAGRPFQP